MRGKGPPRRGLPRPRKTSPACPTPCGRRQATSGRRQATDEDEDEDEDEKKKKKKKNTHNKKKHKNKSGRA